MSKNPAFITLLAMGETYPSEFIEVTGVIIERFAETAYRAKLPNGKETIAFIEKKNEHLKELLQSGDKVKLTLSPADFDRARIDSREEEE